LRMNTVQTSPPPTQALWERARASYARAVAAIGEPAAVAALAALSRDLRRIIIGWVARLEHVVRKLLLAEAGRLFETNGLPALCRPPFRGEVRKERAARMRHLDSTRPETWPARFRFALPRDPRAVPDARAPRIRALWDDAPSCAPPPTRLARLPERQDIAVRLARRLEAMRRVLVDPMPIAQRLARGLYRLARRYPEATLRFAASPSRVNAYDPFDPRLGVDATGAGFYGAHCFRDTS
jgi:hypothetical protein